MPTTIRIASYNVVERKTEPVDELAMRHTAWAGVRRCKWAVHRE